MSPGCPNSAMPQPQPPPDFQWINSSTAKVPKDLEVRTRIRKQAMKQVSVARKRNGNHGKFNLRQYPIFESTPRTRNSESPPNDSVSPGLQNSEGKKNTKEYNGWYPEQQPSLAELAVVGSIPAALSRRSYEVMSMKYGLDTIDLSILTSVEVGRATGELFLEDTARLAPLLSHKQQSFFSYLPARYGYSVCLNDATDCAIARVRQIISPTSHRKDLAVVSLYATALKSLQVALDSPTQRLEPEILCATEILALYELLNPARENAWIHHSAGAARLIRLRGPQKYETEFEKLLFMAHAGPMITEALLNNERCFLELQPWQAVFQSMIVADDSVPDRSEIVVSVMMLMSRIAGIFRDITNAICDSSNPEPSRVNTLACQARELRLDFKEWQARHSHLLSRVAEIRPGHPLFDKLRKLLGLFFACSIMCNRLLIAISPFDGSEIERESQDYAGRILVLKKEATSLAMAPQVGLFLAQKVRIAQATTDTRVEWWETTKTAGVLYGTDVRMVERWKFQRWCRLFGRKTL